MTKAMLVALSVLVLASGAGAAVTYNIGGGEFEDRDGNPLFSFGTDGQLFLLLIDTDGGPFESLDAIAANTGFLAGNDVLVDAWGADWLNTGVDGNVSQAKNNFDQTGQGVAAGAAMALVWFETLLAADVDVLTDQPGGGQYYNYSLQYAAQADPGTHNLNYTFAGEAGRTSLVTAGVPIPEPATLALLGLGGGAILLVRRNSRRRIA